MEESAHWLLLAALLAFLLQAGTHRGASGGGGCARAERAGAEQPEQPEQPEQEAPSAEAGEGFGLAAAERSLKRLVRAQGGAEGGLQSLLLASVFWAWLGASRGGFGGLCFVCGSGAEPSR